MTTTTTKHKQAGETYRNRETGVMFRIDRAFRSAGEWIYDYTVIGGPHSVGVQAQGREYGLNGADDELILIDGFSVEYVAFCDEHDLDRKSVASVARYGCHVRHMEASK